MCTTLAWQVQRTCLGVAPGTVSKVGSGICLLSRLAHARSMRSTAAPVGWREQPGKGCVPAAGCSLLLHSAHQGRTRHTICIFVHHYTSWQTASHQLQHTFLVADGVKHRLNRVHAVQRRCTWRGQTGCFQCCECVSGQQISLPSRPCCHPGRHVHILIPPTCSFAFGLCYPWPMPSPHAAAQIHSPGSWLSA